MYCRAGNWAAYVSKVCTAFVHLQFAWFPNKGFLREGIHAEFNQGLKGRWIALACIPREGILPCYTFALLAASCRCNWRLNLAVVGVVWMRIELSCLPGLPWVHPANRFIFVSEASGYFDYVREIDLSWNAAGFFVVFHSGAYARMKNVFKHGTFLFLFNSSQYIQAAFVSHQFRGKPQAEIPGEVQRSQFFQAVGKYKQLKGWDTVELPWQTTVHPMQTSVWDIHGINSTTDTLKKPWLATEVVHQSSQLLLEQSFW